MTDQRQMPRYQCHKKVWALKISALEIHEDKSATIVPVDSRYARFETEPGWGNRYTDKNYEDLGYYVVYDDGYTSWSPTKAFESGYTLIQ